MVRRPEGRRSRQSKAALWPGKGSRTAHLERLSRFANFRLPSSLPAAPEPVGMQTRSHLVLSFRILPPANRGGGRAPITDSVASGRSAELGGGSGVASLLGRRQNFENGASGGDRPLSKFSTFRLGAVEAGGNLAPVAKVVLPLRCRVAGRRPQGPTPRAKL